MNKWELIEDVEKIGIYNLNLFGNEVKSIPTKTAIKLIKQLDEPEKVKVPHFVADYIEFQKKNNFHVYGAMRVIEDHYDKNVPKWFYEKNIETFVRAWLDGYEVEEEKRYLVKVKGVEDCSSYLKRNTETNKLYFGEKFSNAIAKDLKIYHIYHTRKELEDAGFGWVFDCEGIEIEEVTE